MPPGISRARIAGKGKPFDAVFASCDLVAIGAMRAFEEAGVSIPGDIGIVGFDDIRSPRSRIPR
jgi:DNA-binding LacI/PurR family transcriptional regulator